MTQGQQVQIFLKRSSESTQLNVLVDGKHFSEVSSTGLSLISDDDYQEYPYGAAIPHPELTLYDHPKYLPNPFLKVRLEKSFSYDY